MYHPRHSRTDWPVWNLKSTGVNMRLIHITPSTFTSSKRWYREIDSEFRAAWIVPHIKNRATMAQVNSMSDNSKLIVLNSNEKGELLEPLPSDWTKPEHLGQVVIYNGKWSPPCCKLRTIFAWYKVRMRRPWSRPEQQSHLFEYIGVKCARSMTNE